MFRALAGAIGLALLATHALAADPVEIGVGYLHRAGVKPTLSLVEQPADNNGVAGARLAMEDNNTTGKFLNQHFTLEETRIKDGDDAAMAAVALADHGIGFILVDLDHTDPAVVDRTLALWTNVKDIRCAVRSGAVTGDQRSAAAKLGRCLECGSDGYPCGRGLSEGRIRGRRSNC